MTHAAQAEPEHAVEILRPSRSEWEAAVEQALDQLGLTYAELQEQARTGNFSSAEALNLWVTIGDSRS